MIGQSRTRLLGVTVLVAVFAVGGLTGAVVQRTALADPTLPRAPEKRGPSLFEQLKLTDAQQKQVCSVLKRQADQMKPHEIAIQESWKEHKPAMNAIFQETNAAIDSLLTPEQRAQKDQFRAEREKYFAAREAQRKQSDAKQPQGKGPKTDDHRGARMGPQNPIGISCPGLNDGPHGAPRGPMSDNWGARPSRDSRETTPAAPVVAAKPEYQS